LLNKCLSVIGLGKKTVMDETDWEDSAGNIFDAEFRRKMSETFLETFEEKVSIIQDPENGAEELHKVDGTALTEEQMALLTGFERGWNEAFTTIALVAGWGEEDGT
jgi:hypothetical protein